MSAPPPTTVQVALRCRPLLPDEKYLAKAKEVVTFTNNKNQVLLKGKTAFTFDFAFSPSTSQEYLYMRCVLPVVRSFYNGYNATVFAYGPTGSGKTFTMGSDFQGNYKPAELGVIPRMVKDTYRMIDMVKEQQKFMGQDVPRVSFDVSVMCLQIYKEDVKDLLNPSTPSSRITVRDSAGGDVQIRGVKEVAVHSEEEMLSLFHRASSTRVTASTRLNDQSSRSHAIFTIRLDKFQEMQGKVFNSAGEVLNEDDAADSQSDTSGISSMVEEEKKSKSKMSIRAKPKKVVRTRDGMHMIQSSKLHLVDLAGSEAPKKSGVQGVQFQEAVQINKSLLALGNVISVLGKGQKGEHVPYRSSKLTRLLKNSLGGNSRTLMIACVSPADMYYTDTLNTLKYANRARKIKNKAVLNKEDILNTDEYKKMKGEVKKLRAELAKLKDLDLSKLSGTQQQSGLSPETLEKLERLLDLEDKLQQGQQMKASQSDLEHKMVELMAQTEQKYQDDITGLRKQISELEGQLKKKRLSSLRSKELSLSVGSDSENEDADLERLNQDIKKLKRAHMQLLNDKMKQDEQQLAVGVIPANQTMLNQLMEQQMQMEEKMKDMQAKIAAKQRQLEQMSVEGTRAAKAAAKAAKKASRQIEEVKLLQGPGGSGDNNNSRDPFTGKQKKQARFQDVFDIDEKEEYNWNQRNYGDTLEEFQPTPQGGMDGDMENHQESQITLAEFNYFALDRLPLNMRGQNVKYRVDIVVNALRDQFGFQKQSVINQHEHLLFLLSNAQSHLARGIKTSAAHVHLKLFDNYIKWCERLGVAPRVSPLDEPQGLVVEIALYLLIWGEAGNLRHMPEMMCYIFHGMADELRLMPDDRPVRPEYMYLDHVITPIYDILSSAFRAASHTTRKNYDDFNEFFWDSECLQYEYANSAYFPGGNEPDGEHVAVFIEEEARADGDDANNNNDNGRRAAERRKKRRAARRSDGKRGEDDNNTVSEASKNAPKTFLEKQSLLNPLRSFSTVFWFYLLSFHALYVLAYATHLKGYEYNDPEAMKIYMSIFVSIAFFGVVDELLNAWSLYGLMTKELGKTFGIFVRFAVKGLLLLVLGVLYYWGYTKDESYYDQYFALSTLYTLLLLPYVLFAILPLLGHTLVRARRYGVLGTLTSVWFPDQNLYVGRDVMENMGDTFMYMFFWLFLLTWKLFVSYTFQTKPLVVLTDNILNKEYDERVYLPSPSVNWILIVTVWTPFMLVFIADTLIWFSITQALTGSLIGLSRRLGVVHNFSALTTAISHAPFLFATKVLNLKDSRKDHKNNRSSPPDSQPTTPRCNPANEDNEAAANGAVELAELDLESLSAASEFGSQTNLMTPNSLAISGNWSKVISAGIDYEADHKQEDDFSPRSAPGTAGPSPRFPSSPRRSPRKSPRGGGSGGHKYQELSRATREDRWTKFALTWNEIVNDIRADDLVSDEEQQMLLFRFVSDRQGNMIKFYLPLSLTSGSVDKAITLLNEAAEEYWDSGTSMKKNVEDELYEAMTMDEDQKMMVEAISELWDMVQWFLSTLLGPKHAKEIESVFGFLPRVIEQKQTLAWIRISQLHSVKKKLLDVVRAARVAFDALTTFDWTNGVTSAENPSDEGQIYGLIKSPSTDTLAYLDEVLHGAAAQAAAEKAQSTSVPDHMFTRSFRLNTNSTWMSVGHVNVLRDALRVLLLDIGKLIRKQEDLKDNKAAESAPLMGDSDEDGEHGPTSIDPHRDVVKPLNSILLDAEGFFWDTPYSLEQMQGLFQHRMCEPALSAIYASLTLTNLDTQPESEEARRRLFFFVNSLSMDMPIAPPIKKMLSWSTLTPFYTEDVIYSYQDMCAETHGGISTFFYLQTIYPREWKNFLERVGLGDETNNHVKLTHHEKIMEARLWATRRGQTLYRTVEGMMLYEKALRFLYDVEQPGVNKEFVNDIVNQKFQYVVSCQVYGVQKKTMDPKAKDIEYILKKYLNVRVAYIDHVKSPSYDKYGNFKIKEDFYSVLIKAVNRAGPEDKPLYEIQEVFRVRLPGNPLLGEGKPENQNHAMVFTRGEVLQAIDMNQEGYFEEALKMRNLLQEFQPENCDRRHPPRIVGFREHVYTGGLSSVANYMAMQEATFATLTQRVLDQPLRVRMHYGHPDLFDKLYVMSNAGLSKASKSINLNEDVFAGFNTVLRAGSVTMHEYMQVGKGRDVGLQQLFKFEAKLGAGAAMQALSRDIYRLSTFMDFFRTLSFFFGGIGFYLCNSMVIWALFLFLYARVLVNTFHVTDVRDDPGLATLAYWFGQIGFLLTLPILFSLGLEKGVKQALWDVIKINLSGGPLFFVFNMGTKAHLFEQTLLIGGAKYRATGRGFLTKHETFAELFRFYAFSHFYKAMELLMYLLILASIREGGVDYGVVTWPAYLVVISFLFAPLWFNPIQFEWEQTLDDIRDYFLWMKRKEVDSARSWRAWYLEETDYVDKLHFAQKLRLSFFSLRYALMGVALIYWRDSSEVEILACSGVMILLYLAVSFFNTTFSARNHRLGRLLKAVYMFLLLAALIVAPIYFGVSFSRVMESSATVLGLGYVINALAHTLHAFNIYKTLMYKLSRFYDYCIGVMLLSLLVVLSLLVFPGYVQTRVMFHNAFSRGILINDLLHSNKNENVLPPPRYELETRKNQAVMVKV